MFSHSVRITHIVPVLFLSSLFFILHTSFPLRPTLQSISLPGSFPSLDASNISRFTLPPHWRPKSVWSPPPLLSTRRVFLSTLPSHSTDGLGHRLTIINYELNLARLLNASYLHRIASYGSLSPDEDPNAVERFFGWDVLNETRSWFLDSYCARTGRMHARNCEKQHLTRGEERWVYCEQLRENDRFNKLVWIPEQLGDCLKDGGVECDNALENFGWEHSGEGVVFMLMPSMCETEYRYGNFVPTGGWLRQLYWERMRKRDVIEGLSSDRVEVGVHVRRGDILGLAHREVTSDEEFVSVIARVARAARGWLGWGVRVSVYSEGVLEEGGGLHDVGYMRKVYVDENSTEWGDGERHWRDMLSREGCDWVDVRMRVAEDTLSSLHEMIRMDVFVGSISGLSGVLVRQLARGVVLLPGEKDGGLWDLRWNDEKGFVEEGVLGNGISEVVVRRGVDEQRGDGGE